MDPRRLERAQRRAERPHLPRHDSASPSTFKQLLESPRLPAVAALEDACRRIERLSDGELRERMARYRKVLAARADRLEGARASTCPTPSGPTATGPALTAEEMRSVLVLETFKAMIGKSSDWPELLKEI
ncbi:MAG: hypothetical protein MZV70_55680 [Desulfobacterales bacterium]|nr:hypothetical protein [Desulfobacterales bacterium]